MILPPTLKEIEPFDGNAIQRLSDKAFEIRADGIYSVKEWVAWQDVLENAGMAKVCAEKVASALVNLDVGSALAIECQVNSAAMVYFAQAALELAAVRTDAQLNLGFQYTKLFTDRDFRKAVKSVEPRFGAFFDKHLAAMKLIRDYRIAWYHHASGGSKLFAAGIDQHGPVDVGVMVPRNPQAFSTSIAVKEYEEKGRDWLMPVGVFASQTFKSMASAVYDCIDILTSKATP